MSSSSSGKNAAAAPLSLTPKQEAFAQKFVETGNASEAYRHAYTVRETTKPESIWQAASKLLATPKVSSRVAALQSELRQRHDITVNDLLDEYDENRTEAFRTSQMAAANGATMGKAKLLGYENGDSRTVGGATKVVAMSDMEMARRIAVMLERASNKGDLRIAEFL